MTDQSESAMDLPDQMAILLLDGCCREAAQADIVSMELDGLRHSLAEPYQPHLEALSDEMRMTATLLRDLADRSQVYAGRVPIVLNYLDTLLPCLSRSLRDITANYEDRSMSRENRWRKMYNSMTDEVHGLPLTQRFLLYNHFLGMLLMLIARSPGFDLAQLEAIRFRILTIRELRGIPPPPVQAGPPILPETLLLPKSSHQTTHWAENIFANPLSIQTALQHNMSSSALGPHLPWGYLDIPSNSRILLRRPFNNETLSVTFFLHGLNGAPYVLLRTYYRGSPWFSLYGVHELRIYCTGKGLLLTRWSSSQNCAKLWASLYPDTWEEMVLLHGTFVTLKLGSPFTVQVATAELRLSEHRLFQAQIIDDGLRHILIVYQNTSSTSLRLLATVMDGELRGSPVWTAFVTHHKSSPAWIIRKSKHRVWLHALHLHIFCNQYRQDQQRQGKAGAFEIYFVSGEAPARFHEVFDPPPPPAALEDFSTAAASTPDRTVLHG